MQNDDSKRMNNVVYEREMSVGYSENTHLIEQSAYKYSLQERADPNLYRPLFDYDSVPKVSFNHRFVPVNMPEKIRITDTTFRDGQQAMNPFTVKQIVDLYKMLHRLGGEQGIISQSEFFVYTEKDRRALEECMALGYEFPEITTWIRASKKDFELVKSLGIRETGILVSCSDYHIYNKMGLTRKSAMEKYLSVIGEVLDMGISPRCHFEDITRADFYGFVLPLAEAIEELCESYGIPVVMTSPDHPTGSDRVAEVAAKVEGDLFINIQGDEPLMEPEMVRQVIRLFDDPEVYFGSLKKKITDPDLIAADSTVKVVTDDLNNAMYFSRNPIPSGLKDVDKVDVYKHVGIYAYKRDFLLKFGAMPQSSLELAECVEPLRAMQAGYKMRFAETEYENISVDYPRHLDEVIAEIRRLGLDKTIEG